MPLPTVNLEIEKTLQAWFSTIPEVISLIGDRISPDGGKQNTIKPYVVYERIFHNRWRHLKGVSYVSRSLIQFSIFADTPAEAKRIASVMQNAVDDFVRGTMLGVVIQQIFVEDDRDISQKPINATERMSYGRSFDVNVIWEE